MSSQRIGKFQRPKLSLNQKDKIVGAKSLPELIHFNAEFNPTHIFCKQAEVAGREGGEPVYRVHDISMKELKLAIESCVVWISCALASSTFKENGPVALYLESDIGLFIHFAALLEMGIPVCFPETNSYI